MKTLTVLLKDHEHSAKKEKENHLLLKHEEIYKR